MGVVVVVVVVVVVSYDFKRNDCSAPRTRGNDGPLQVVPKAISLLVIASNLPYI